MNMLDQFAKNGEAMAKSSVDANKKLMRARCENIVAEMEEEYVLSASEAIIDKVLASESYRNAKTIFCYMHFGKEPMTDRIIAQAQADGKRVCVPLCVGKHEMVAKLYNTGDELGRGAFGIREPLASAPTVERDEIDLALIPCVACDRNGKRIGHGAGYYDIFLENTKFTKMALCFEKLIMGNIPWYKDDVVMDYVATDENIYGDRWRAETDQNAHILPLR